MQPRLLPKIERAALKSQYFQKKEMEKGGVCCLSVISQAFAPAWAASFPLRARGGHWGCVSAAGSRCAARAGRPFGLPAYNRQRQSSARRHRSCLPHRPASPVRFEELGGMFWRSFASHVWRKPCAAVILLHLHGAAGPFGTAPGWFCMAPGPHPLSRGRF